MKNSIGTAFVSLALVLTGTGCAKDPDSRDVKDALSEALQAETVNTTVGALPLGKSIATNFDGGRQFLIAKKSGNLPENPDCGLFDITVSRPTSQYTFFSSGDSDWEKGVTVCVPR